MEEQIIQIINRCLKCGRERKLYGQSSLCKSCYNSIHIDIDKQKEYERKWKEKNPNYFKEYYLKNKEKKNE